MPFGSYVAYLPPPSAVMDDPPTPTPSPAFRVLCFPKRADVAILGVLLKEREETVQALTMDLDSTVTSVAVGVLVRHFHFSEACGEGEGWRGVGAGGGIARM